jgi:hypothetical protein
MVCPGSVLLAQGVSDAESEYAMEGTLAHHVAQACLSTEQDAWERMSHSENITKDMADAVQVYLDNLRYSYPDRQQDKFFVEYSFHCPDLHPLFYGQADAVYIDEANRTLHVHDYKHGAGIVVDVKENLQCMYYACGVLEAMQLRADVDKVVLHIAQPRGWHTDGPLRHWGISTLDLEAWLDDVLLPAMKHAEVSRDTLSGEHCRFCPVRKMDCPQISKDFDELEELMTLITDKGGAKNLSAAKLGRFLTLFDVAKIISKSANETAFARLSAGKKVPGRKLAHGRANRTWKDDAEDACVKKFGDKAYAERKLKSPAQMEAMPEGEKLTAEFAFKPDAGLTVVAAGDARAAVSKDTKSLFTDASKKGKK